MKKSIVQLTAFRVLLFLCLLFQTLSTTSSTSTSSTILPQLKIVSPSPNALLWEDLVLELELIVPSNVTNALQFEVCLNVTTHAQLQTHTCFPVVLSSEDTTQGNPLLTEITLSIEDAGSFVVIVYIKECNIDTEQHCHSNIHVHTCRIGTFGVIRGGRKCKAKWTLEHTPDIASTATQLIQQQALHPGAIPQDERTVCRQQDLTHQCFFPSNAACFDHATHSWWVQGNSLNSQRLDQFVNDPASFLDVFVGPYKRSIENGIAVQLISDVTNKHSELNKRHTLHHSETVTLIVPYMRHVFFHAVADNAFQIYATMLSLQTTTAKATTSKVLLLTQKQSKYDFLLETVLGIGNVLYLGDMLTHTNTDTNTNVLHCFDGLLTGVQHRQNAQLHLSHKDVEHRHRFNIWDKSTFKSFRNQMLMSSKVIFPLETKPHLTMLVHRARSEAQSLPGKFITKEIRQIINQNELLETVQNIVTTSTCDEKATYKRTNTRTAVLVTLENLSFAKQLEMLVETEIFIHMHGSAGALAFFLPKGATFIELRPHKFVWTTWALEIAATNDLIATQWVNGNAQTSTFPIHPYEDNFDKETLQHFKTVSRCDAVALEQSTGIEDLETWCQQYYRDQHTVVDVEVVGEMLKEALKKGLYCNGGKRT